MDEKTKKEIVDYSHIKKISSEFQRTGFIEDAVNFFELIRPGLIILDEKEKSHDGREDKERDN